MAAQPYTPLFPMLLHLMKSKLHRLTVTGSDLNYEGSLRLDAELMRRANMMPFELIWVWNINNGARFQTYLIEGTPGSRECILNGAAARMVQRGDRVIVIAECTLTPEQAATHQPLVLVVDEENRIIDTTVGQTSGGAGQFKTKSGESKSAQTQPNTWSQ